MSHPLPRRALSVRQPWAELILRGIKTLEVRSRPTRVRGPVQIYASLKLEAGPKQLQAHHRFALDLEQLPLGVLSGVLKNPRRFDVFTKPQRQPQPSFFFVDLNSAE